MNLNSFTPANRPISRRNFLTRCGLLSAAALTAPAMFSGTSAKGAPSADAIPTALKKYPIGLELYSVRDELARDLPNTLTTVATMGYEVVEFYSPYYNWSLPYAKSVRSLMDD